MSNTKSIFTEKDKYSGKQEFSHVSILKCPHTLFKKSSTLIFKYIQTLLNNIP